MIARVAVPALVVLIQWRIGLEVGAGQIVEQYLEGDVEQIAPAIGQVAEQRPLVLEQSIMAAVEHVRGSEGVVGAEQIRQRRCAVPLPMQPPLTARRNQSISAQDKEHR